MLKALVLAPILFLALFFQGKAQEQSNARQTSYALTSDTLLLDTVSLVPGSLVLMAGGKAVDTSAYFLQPVSSLLIWKPGKKPEGDSLTAQFRVLPIKLDKPYFHKDPGRIAPDASGAVNPFKYTSKDQRSPLFNLGGLDKQGSISRGVNFGNNQDLSVNSNLNLQLAGRLNERVGIAAAISDDNIPIQPDGNTQQLQEFDRVFIKLFDQQSSLVAGDFNLYKPNSYFMTYQKRAQGASFQTRFPVIGADTTEDKMYLQGSAAVSKGKFARNILQGVEGNQGPYRLRGAEGEQFIIVLAGTERVYIDGKLLTRGQSMDYVIDYNTAEVTFSARQLITKDKRIVVEFQYSDKNYARSLFQFTDEFTKDRLKLRFNFYSEQDSKNQPLQQDLTDERREVLRLAGDSLNSAVAAGIDSVAFNEDEILYNLIDTIVQVAEQSGDSTIFIDVPYDSIFVRATNSELPAYRLTFSEVGIGQGNYVLDQSLANGRVFRWVPPVQGVRQGDYEPVILLISPKQQQMVTLGGSYQFDDRSTVTFEGAFSNNDLNTFSDLDAGDDQGVAFKSNVGRAFDLSKSDTTNPWQVTAAGGIEFLSRDFSAIERFRTVEFDRDWNIRDLNITGEQLILEGAAGLRKAELGSVEVVRKSFSSGSTYRADRNELRALVRRPGFNLTYNGSLTNTSGSLATSSFLRHKSLVTKKIKFLEVGYRDDFENNRYSDPEADTLQANSYAFWEWEAFVANSDTTGNRYRVNYVQRTDRGAANDRIQRATYGESVGFTFDLIKNPKNKLRGRVAYRTLEIIDSALTNSEPDQTFLNRLEYNVTLLKGAVTSSSFYEVSSGLESRKEFTFLPVDVGQGNYTWNDYNGDGLRQLDEFEIAPFQDTANYIKVFTPTDIYVKVFSNQFNQSIFIRPAAVWNGKTGIRKFLTRFSNQVAYSIDRKTEQEGELSRFNPFLADIADSNLLNLNSNIRNTLFFNRSSPTFGADLSYQNIRSKTFLTNGFDSRGTESATLKARWNMSRAFALLGEYSNGQRLSNSEAFPNRNFLIDFFNTKPTFTYQPGTTFRVSLSYTYEEKENVLSPGDENPVAGGERVVNQTLGTELKYNSVGKGSLLLSANYISLEYSGETNNAVSFELLDGLQPGRNGTWSVSYQRTLANNMQLNLNYTGRTSENLPLIHTGGVQLRAFF